MDPVDAEIGKEDEEGELQVVVPGEGGGAGCVVEFGVAPDFGEEEGRREDGHDGHGGHGLFHFQADLVLEVFRVGEGCVVEDEEVGSCCTGKVDEEAEQPAYGVNARQGLVRQGSSSPGYQIQTQRLSVDRVSRPRALIGILRWL